jgi:hypothetical protein
MTPKWLARGDTLIRSPRALTVSMLAADGSAVNRYPAGDQLLSSPSAHSSFVAIR